jgi:hypothetical protein
MILKSIFCFGIVCAAILLIGGSCGPKKVQGEYDVTGSTGVSTASITFASPIQSNAQATSVSLPWSYSFPGTITEGTYQGTYVYLYAQVDTGSSPAAVTVTIKENGDVFQQATTTVTSGSPTGAAVSVSGSF